MALGGALVVGIVVVGGAYLLARKIAWSDARPALAPLSVFGDFVWSPPLAAPTPDERRP